MKKSAVKAFMMSLAVSLVGAAMILSSMPFSTSPGTAFASHSSSSSSSSGGSYRIVAWNDLGMHCACPSFQGFLLLPPFNTIRAQVFQFGSNDPVPLTSSNIGSLSVSYAMVEDTDANLQADAYYQQWITYSPKLFPPPYQPVVNGKVVSISGAGLAGTMAYDSNLLDWKAVGVPAYPITTGNTAKDVMTDPLGGPNRDPYLTANVYLKNSTGSVLAQTTTVVPVAFGGCCGCHLRLAGANGYPSTPQGSFQYLGKLHGQNSSKIDFNYLDPTGDGAAGPLRCSWCHWDPAMGESAAPGLAAVWPNYVIMAGASFTRADVKVSQYSFSDVLHRFHTQDAIVLGQYDANIAVNCYDCHPGNGVNCYRGAHKTKTAIWCVDCHGNLNQRVAAGQLTQPWLVSTLPSCTSPASGITSAFACHTTRTVGGTTYPTNPSLFGKFINSRGHKGSIKCQTCHGEAHGEAPSTLAADNVQLTNLQNSVPGANYPTGKDATYALGVCQFCHPTKTNTWGVPPHQ